MIGATAWPDGVDPRTYFTPLPVEPKDELPTPLVIHPADAWAFGIEADQEDHA